MIDTKGRDAIGPKTLTPRLRRGVSVRGNRDFFSAGIHELGSVIMIQFEDAFHV
jgi:hypothetical protein